MSDNKWEPKTTIYEFELDNFNLATAPIPFKGAQLIFMGYRVTIKAQEPKTKKEFEKIFNDYMNEEKKQEECDIMLRKKVLELSKEFDY